MNDCFDFIPRGQSGEECARIADELERALGERIAAPRYAKVRETLAALPSLTEQERADFFAAMGWRKAMFLDDAWLWPCLTLPPGRGSPPTPESFQKWTRRRILPRLKKGAKEMPAAVPHFGPVAEVAERLLKLDFSPAWKPGSWINKEAIDWRPRATMPDNCLVTHVFRFLPFTALAYRFAQTGEERFAEGLVRILFDITWEIPGNVVSEVGVGGPRTRWGMDALDVASRTTLLLAIYRHAGSAEAFDPLATLLTWKTLYFCGARAFEFWHKSGHNIVFAEASALAEVAFVLPEFAEAPKWSEAAQRRLIGVMRGAIMADGSNVEASPCYHHSYVGAPMSVLERARQTGAKLLPEFVRLVRSRGKAAAEFWPKILTPNRRLPPIGDSWPADITPALRQLARQYRSKRLAGLADAATPGGRPRAASCFLPVQRWAVMRSSWAADALWCAFVMRGYRHGHDDYDLFHVEVQAGQQRLLLDSGCIDYAENRPVCDATKEHNTLVVDGRNQLPCDAESVRWHSTDSFDWAEGLSVAFPGILHRRAVCFLKPNCFVILDRVTHVFDARPHEFSFYWHLPPKHPVRFEGHTVRTEHPEAPNAELRWAGGEDWALREAKGFIAEDYGSKQEGSVAVFEGKTDKPFSVATVILPRAGGAQGAADWGVRRVPVVWQNAGDGEVLPDGMAIGLELSRPGRRCTLLWCYPGYGEKTVGEWSTDGEWLLAFEDGKGAPQAFARNASACEHAGRTVEYKRVVNQADG